MALNTLRVYYLVYFMFQKSVIDDMRVRYPKEFTTEKKDNYIDQAIIRQSFMKAAVFYEDLSHEIVSEVPVYSVSTVRYFRLLFHC